MNWNEQQKEVLEAKENKILVLAGAGSGKTAVLKEKIKILVDRGVKKEEILAISFTNEAKDEMKERVESEIGKGVTFLTLHKLGKKMLESVQKEKKEEKIDRQIIPEEKKEKTISDFIETYTSWEEDKTYKEFKKEEKTMTMMIDYAIANDIEIKQLREKKLLEKQKERLNAISKNDKNTKVLFMYIYEEYLEYLEKNNLMDIAQMVTRPIKIAKNKEIADIMASKYKYVFIDEFQDINDRQQELVEIVARDAELLFVVGDDYQSIYGFQGSNVQNILNFKKKHPEAREIKLEINYRSTNTIVKASNDVIKNNAEQVQKNMKGQEEENEQKIILIEANEKKAEYKKVAKRVKKLLEEGIKKREISILYRSNNEKKGMEEALNEVNLDEKIILTDYENPYRYLFKQYIDFLENQRDMKLFKTITIDSNKGLGEKTFEKIEKFVETRGLNGETLIAVVRESMKGLGMTKWNRIKAYIYLKDMEELLAIASGDFDAIVSKISAILQKNKKNSFVLNQIQKAEKEIKNLKNKKEIAEKIKKSSNTTRMIEDEITLQTVHASKGKEYDVVFILGANESNFPLSYAKTEKQIAEERRLFYVAMTRARKQLYISYSRTNNKVKDSEGEKREFEISRFVKEIEDKYLEKI